MILSESAPATGTTVDAAIDMSFDAWSRLIGREATGAALLEAGDVRASGDPDITRAVLGIPAK